MKAILALEDGTIFEGVSIGVPGETVGDVVFTTVMCGFQESLTDPSYYGMILSFTDPIVDNYGINSTDFESDRIQPFGVIMKDPSDTPSNFRCEGTMNEFLKKNKIVGISDIDTRMLTRHLRDNGTMKGMITTDSKFDFAKKVTLIKSAKIERPLFKVAASKTTELSKEYKEKCTVAVIDLGIKQSVVDGLVASGKHVYRFPATTSIKDIKAVKPNGILISDGPGDPLDYPELLTLMSDIKKLDIPTFAVGLGHLLMAMANGMKVEKLPFGHHGSHPVKDLERDATFAAVSNQNYTLDQSSLKKGCAEITHIDWHDRTVEGIRYTSSPILGLQFYPDFIIGAHNASYLLEKFDEMMKR